MLIELDHSPLYIYTITKAIALLEIRNDYGSLKFDKPHCISIDAFPFWGIKFPSVCRIGKRCSRRLPFWDFWNLFSRRLFLDLEGPALFFVVCLFVEFVFPDLENKWRIDEYFVFSMLFIFGMVFMGWFVGRNGNVKWFLKIKYSRESHWQFFSCVLSLIRSVSKKKGTKRKHTQVYYG